MLLLWLIGFVFLGLLLAWQPALWAVSVFQIGIFGVGAVALARRMRRPEGFSMAPDVAAVCLLVVWGPMQIALHRSVYAYETWNAALQWLALCATYLLARSLLQSRDVRRQFLSILIWAGGAVALFSVILHFSSPQRVYGIFESRYPSYGPFIYKNQFSAFLELLLPIAFFRMTAVKRGKTGYAIVFAALFACIVASLSRAGLIVALLEVLVLAFVSWRRRVVTGGALLKSGVPVVLLMIIFVLIVGTDSVSARFQEQNALTVRKPLAESTLKMIRERPLTGYGLGTWRLVYPEFATFDVAVVANEAHDDWLQWAAEGGIPFVLILFGLAAWLSTLAWKHVWGLGIPAVFLHCFFDYPTHLPALAAVFFLLAGALAATAVRKRAADQPNVGEWSVLAVRTSAE